MGLTYHSGDVGFNPNQSYGSGGGSSSSSSGGGGSSGGGRGTYYTGSGTYIDPSGKGFSMKKAPSGAKVVSGIDPILQGQQEAARQEAARKAAEEAARKAEIARQELARKEAARQEAARKAAEEKARQKQLSIVQKNKLFERKSPLSNLDNIIKSNQQSSIQQNQASQSQSQQNFLKLEVQRYAKAGYSPMDAIRLGQESVKRGGVSFTPQESESILNNVQFRRSNGYNRNINGTDSGRLHVDNKQSSMDNLRDNFDNNINQKIKEKQIQKQAVIEKYNPNLKNIRLSISEAIQRILGNIKEKWKTRGTGFVSAQEILEPLEYTGELKSEQKVLLMNTGDILGVDESLTKLQMKQYEKSGLGKIITRQEASDISAEKYSSINYKDMIPDAAYYKISEDIQKKLLPEYQKKLNTGNLTEEEANKQYQKAVVEEYEKQATETQKYFIEKEKLGIGERTGKDVAEKIPAALETGALIALSTNPVGAVAASAYIATQGEKNIARAILDKNLSDTQRILLGASGTAQAALGAFGGAKTISSIEKQIANDIIINKINELNKKNIKFVGLTIQGDKSAIGVLKGVQKSGSLKTEYELAGIIKKINNKAYFMPYGSGTATTTGNVLNTPEKQLNIFATTGSQLGSKGINIPLNEKLSKIFSKDVAEEILSTGALYQKGSLGITNRIEIPTGKIITKPNKLTQNYFDDLVNNMRLGNQIDINFAETNVLRLKKGWFYSQSADKSIKGFTKVINVDDLMRGGYNIKANPSDDIFKVALEQQQQKQIEANLINKLNQVNVNKINQLKTIQDSSIKNIVQGAGKSNVNQIIKSSEIVSTQINPVKEQIKIDQPKVKVIEKTSPKFDVKQQTRNVQSEVRTETKTKSVQDFSQQTKNLLKEVQKPSEKYNQMQNLKSKQRQVQQQTQQQINSILNIQKMRPPRININNIGIPRIPNLFKLPKKKKEKKKIRKIFGKRIRKERKEGYTATIESALLQNRPVQLSRKDYQRLKKRTFSGLEARPVISIKEPKKELDVDVDFSI